MEDLTIDALLETCRGWYSPPPLAVHPPRRARVPGGAGDSVVYCEIPDRNISCMGI
jgi:hypothetical protein